MSAEFKIDLHKLLAGSRLESAIDSLATLGGFVPGIMLGVLLILSNPGAMRTELARIRTGFDFGNWFLLVVALIATYFFGSCLLLFTTFVRYVFWKLASLSLWACRPLSQVISEKVLVPMHVKARSLWIKQTFVFWIGRLRYFYMPPFDQRDTARSLTAAVRRLLEIRYGIKEDGGLSTAWADVLALPPRRHQHVGRWITMFHATGWGIVALSMLRLLPYGKGALAPLGYYLIVVGLWAEWTVFRNFANVDWVFLMRLRGALEEIAVETLARHPELPTPRSAEPREPEF